MTATFRHRLIRLLLLPLLLLVSGCFDSTPMPEAPQFKVGFTRFPPFKLDVAFIDVVEEYRSSGKAPYVEQFFTVSPASAMRTWIEDRLQTVGQERYLQVVIKDASVKETRLQRTEGMKGVFTKEQSERYDARLEVEMRIYGSRSALSEANIHVTATRSATIREDASPVDRDRLFNRMTVELMEVMNAELEKNIYAYFGNYLDFSQPGEPALPPASMR